MTSFAPALLLIASLQAAPARVEVLPATAEVTVDAAVTLSARVLDADGELLTDAAPRWLSLNPELFTVDQGGRVTGIRPGKGQIAAVIGGTIAGFADVTVPQLGASSLDVTPLAPIVAGTSAPLRVTATTRLGERLDEPDLTYESGSPEVAGVDVLGRVYGRSPGTAAITVRSGEAVQTARVTVEPNPGLAFALEPDGATVRTGDVVRFRIDARSEGGGGGPEVSPAWTVAGVGGGDRHGRTRGRFRGRRARPLPRLRRHRRGSRPKHQRRRHREASGVRAGRGRAGRDLYAPFRRHVGVRGARWPGLCLRRHLHARLG